MCRKEIEKLYDEGKYNEAIEMIDKIYLKNPEQENKLLFKKALALNHLEEYDKSIKTLKVFIKSCTEKEKYYAYILMNNCYANKDDIDNSYECLKKAVEIDSDDDFVLKQISITSFIKLDYENTYRYIKKLMELGKADFEDYNNMIFACINLKRYDEALDYALELNELDSNNVDAFITLGIIYEEIEDKEKLKEINERIIKLEDDGDLEIQLLKAQALLDLGLEKESFDLIDKAIKMNSYNPFPYIMKAMLYQKIGKIEEASECISEAIELDPGVVLKMLKINSTHNTS